MKNKWLGFLILIFISAIAVGIIFYFNSKFNKEVDKITKQGESVLIDSTAEWQVYQSRKYQFKIKYPKDWKLIEHNIQYIGFASPEMYSQLGVFGAREEIVLMI